MASFRVVLIKPSHYDDEGYVIRWMRASIPSNTLACLYTITDRVKTSGRLGPDVEIVTDIYDEMNQQIRVDTIIQQLNASGSPQGIVCLAGVQSNQFPRAVDLGRKFRAAGIPTLIGGFHVSGCLSMLDTLPDDLQAAMANGITLVAGEVEEYWGDVLEDALHGRLKPLYNFLDDLPSLENQSLPLLPADFVKRYVGHLATFDAGRGCPFVCSFCTIINVQGRKSRGRTADDIEAILRENHRLGIKRYFVTDDDFARNKNWESIFDRMIQLREQDGIGISFILQVDTASYRIPRFVEKAGRAGCRKVFIGLESVNTTTLKETGKKQNNVAQYREMLQAWRKQGCVTYAGYIIGFPNDTYESVMQDVEVLKHELPLDLVEFFVLTPLPGSEDHQRLVRQGAWLDPDMNKYDTEHPCAVHPKMSYKEWMQAYNDAWKTFYTFEHMDTILRRRRADGNSVGKMIGQLFWFCGSMFVEGVHPLQAGIIRRKHRFERRPTLPLEGRIVYAWRRVREVTAEVAGSARLILRILMINWRVQKDPAARTYRDLALTPVPSKRQASLTKITLPAANGHTEPEKVDSLTS